jgi:hypothetical protein
MVGVHFPVDKYLHDSSVSGRGVTKGSFKDWDAKWYGNSTVGHNTLGNFVKIIYENWVVNTLHKTL